MMTDREKLIVRWLLSAIDDYQKPVSFTVSVPPKFGEFEKRNAEAQAIFNKNAKNLERAIGAAKEMVS